MNYILMTEDINFDFGSFFGNIDTKTFNIYDNDSIKKQTKFQYSGKIFNIIDTDSFLKKIIKDRREYIEYKNLKKMKNENSNKICIIQYMNGKFAMKPVDLDLNDYIFDEFLFIEYIYQKINRYENQLGIAIYNDEKIYFFKDDIGKKSLGYKINPFILSSMNYDYEIDGLRLYIYDVKEKKLFTKFKPNSCLLPNYIKSANELIADFKLKLHKHKYIFDYTFDKHPLYGFNDTFMKTIDRTWIVETKDLKLNEVNHILPNINTYLTKKYLIETIINFNKKNDIDQNDKFNYIYLKTFIEYFLESIKKKLLLEENIVVYFSGGVDSTLVVVFLHLSLPINKTIYLINTGFINSHDRNIGIESYNELKKTFHERNFVFIENNLEISKINEYKEKIKRIIFPKTKNMDINIGIIFYFSTLIAKNYSNVIFIGSGADELFGGYNKYKNLNISYNEDKDINKKCDENLHINSSRTKSNMFFDLLTISEENLVRDDRIISSFGLEAITPFLDINTIIFSLNLPNSCFLNYTKKKVINKYLLRLTLEHFGMSKTAYHLKKAMQYGTGLNKYEKHYI